MKIRTRALIGALALLHMECIANAAAVRPGGPAPFTLTGSVTLAVAGTSVICNISVKVKPAQSGADGHVFTPPMATDPSHADGPTIQTQITDQKFSGNPICSSMLLTTSFGGVTLVSSTGSPPNTSWVIQITGMVISNPAMGITCSGPIVATWNNPPGGTGGGSLVIPLQTISGGCTFSGTATPSTPLRID